jgi:hypothetical protein
MSVLSVLCAQESRLFLTLVNRVNEVVALQAPGDQWNVIMWLLVFNTGRFQQVCASKTSFLGNTLKAMPKYML